MSEPENRTSALFGTKTSRGRMQGGVFLLAIGCLLGLAALVLFFIGLGQNQARLGPANPYYDWVRPALSLAPVALGAILMGITVALPTRTGLRVTSYVGAALCGVTTVLFALHYPRNFNVASKGSPLTDYMAFDVGLFALGLAMMVASVVTSVIGYYLGRAATAQGEAAGEEEDAYGAGYEVPDWVVERDIEYAMKKYGVQWGGDDNSGDKAIVVNVADSFAGAKIGGLGKARVVQLDAEQVDAGVAGLTKVRPQKGGALPSQWTDEATQALVAFRRQKEANPKQFQVKRSLWRKLADAVTGRHTVPQAPVVKVSGRPAGKAAAAAPSNGAGAPARRGKTIVIEDPK